MHLAQKLNEYTVLWRFKFYKGDKSLEDEECNGPPWAADNNQEPSSKLWKNTTLTILWSFSIEANWKGEKAP